ncbi:chromosome partitioning protein ParB [Clostridia bacterium]|nr:chromosome partitioning protein ParB [Clostridia bacterium]
MAKRTALGNGLESIFTANPYEAIVGEEVITSLKLSVIEPKADQPRQNFSEEPLQELAESIKKHGVIQPIVVRSLHTGNYQIIAGERRWRASKIAGLTEVPVVIKDADDITASEMALIENLQREDLNPIEEAQAYQYLADKYSLTQEEIAERVAKSRPAVANSLRLLSLPNEIKSMIKKGDLTAGHAKVLLSSHTPSLQLEAANAAVANGLSVKETSALIAKKELENEINKVRETEKKSPGGQLEQELAYLRKISVIASERMNHRINICPKRNAKNPNGSAGEGRIEIEYKSPDELEELIKQLCGDEIFEEE